MVKGERGSERKRQQKESIFLSLFLLSLIPPKNWKRRIETKNSDPMISNILQAQEGDETSILQLYRTLAQLRASEDGLAYGLLQYAKVDDNVFSFVREFDGTNRYNIRRHLLEAKGSNCIHAN